MLCTQIELTSPHGAKEVWWIPVPAGKAKVGEQIMHESVHWEITGVFTTLADTDIPENSRVAERFKRFSHTEAIMSI